MPSSDCVCPQCNHILYILDLDKEGRRVSFGCTNHSCELVGFIINEKIYFAYKEKQEDMSDTTANILEVFDTCCDIIQDLDIETEEFNFCRDVIVSSLTYLSRKRKSNESER